MSSNTKDPLEKQDTTSESTEPSSSDNEMEEAGENLEHLKIEERHSKEVVKEDSGESKPLGSPNQEVRNDDLLNEPIAGPSGLQRLHLETSDAMSDPDSKNASLTDNPKEKSMENSYERNIRARMIRDSDANSSPPFIQSSTGVTPTSILNENLSISTSSKPQDKKDYGKRPLHDVIHEFMHGPTGGSPNPRLGMYAGDSANTSADIPSIRSEIAGSSVEGSVYHDALETLAKEQSSISYASAVERQSSEASDANLSEIPEDNAPPPTPESSSLSTSTDSGEQGYQAYLARLQMEADARGQPTGTSSGIGSTNQSELGHLEAWNRAGEMGYYRHNVDDPNQDVPALGCELPPISESVEGEQDPNQERREELNWRDDAARGCRVRRMRVEGRDDARGSPSKRRRPSKLLSEKSKVEIVAEKLRPKPDPEKTFKMIASKLAHLGSSSSSTEPKSSSSDEPHFGDSPEVESESLEVSQSEMGRKPWQKPGLLRSMQFTRMPSRDSIIAEEEEDRSSPLREQDPELVEAKDSTTERMQITPKKDQGTAENVKLSESRPESSDKVFASEAQITLKQPGKSIEVSVIKRTVGKSKREPKLRNSPPSDEKVDSTAAKAATSRPKKKARPDKVPEIRRRTRHDSGDPFPESVNLGNLQQSESTSTPDLSDYSQSDDEKETEL